MRESTKSYLKGINNNKHMNCKIQSKQDILEKSLLEFFSIKENVDRIIPIIAKTEKKKLSDKPEISLRILDWFITNYSKTHNVVYRLDNGEPFDVFRSYKSQLKVFSKKSFDPFCRVHKDSNSNVQKPIRRRSNKSNVRSTKPIQLHYVTDMGEERVMNTVDTMIGQLAFCRWAIQNKVLDYVEENFDDINNDMNKHAKRNRTSVTLKTKKSSITATRTYTKKNVRIVVEFD